MVDPDLELRLARAFEAARARWPDVVVDPEVFEAYASARSPGGGVDRWSAEELYLVCALVAGDRHALARFDAEYLAALDGVLARFGDPALVEEVRQVLRARLLVGAEARIATFTGKGPLAKWIEVAALRAAISLRRAVRDVPVDERTIGALHAAATIDPRLAHLKALYSARFAEAWRAALRALSPEDRTLLRLHAVDRVPVDRIGALYGIHATTAARRVRQVKERLAMSVHAILQDRLDVTPDELKSILALIQSEIDVTLGELLSRGDDDLHEFSPAPR